MQYFKGDPVEKKFVGSSSQVFLGIFAELQKFFDDAYNCYKLGEALYDENTTVLTRAVA
ncbi:MAG: hypothetical protein LBF97_04405 [Elusimicrobiota bacterium]|jgi:hypothetical protein|nr:hypothetical protein [Elusimicrobiota bacterium]